MTVWPAPSFAYRRAVLVDERVAWSRRAVKFLNRHGRWCDLCEARTVTLGPFTLPAKLEVHHRNGRGVTCPVGQEFDGELMVLCCRCHRRITVRHRRIARARHIRTKDAYGHDTLEYSQIIADVTNAACRFHLGRAIRVGFRQMLFGEPPNKGGVVTQPRRAHPPAT